MEIDKENWQKYKEEERKFAKENAKKAGGKTDNIVRIEVGGTAQFSINMKFLTHFKGSLLEQTFSKHWVDLKRVTSTSISPHLIPADQKGQVNNPS